MRAFLRALLDIFYAALPFKDGPPGKIVLRELGKNCSKVNLTITEGPETPGARNPRLVSAVNALTPARPELRVLHMKHFYPLMIEVDELKIVELLQNEVAGVIEDVAALMSSEPIQKHFKADAVVKIFAGMNLET